MKKVLLLIVLFTSQMLSAQNGFSFYEEDGLWGVRYNGETCLLPKFDQLAWVHPHLKVANYYTGESGSGYRGVQIPSSSEVAIFFFKEKGKWGITSVWEIIAPAFCDSLLTFNVKNIFQDINYSLFIFKKEGKWGVCDIEGNILVPPTYDTNDITMVDVYSKKEWDGVDQDLKKKSLKNMPLIYNNTYFDGKVKGEYVTMDILGMQVPRIKAYKSKLWKSEKKRAKTDKTNESVLSNRILSIQQKRDDAYRAHSLIVDKGNGYPYKIYFGRRNGKLVDVEGDSAVINGFPCVVTDFGFISMPIVYSSLEDRLVRNPFDVYAMCGYLEKEGWEFNQKYHDSNSISIQKKRIDYYTELADAYNYILSQIDSKTDKLAYNYVFYRYADAKGDAKEAADRIKHIEYKAQRRDQLINNLNSFANSLATTANILQGNSSSAYTSSASSSSYSSSTSRKETTPSSNSTMSLSDARNYQVQRNTYNKWANDLMAMKNHNGKYQNGYTQSDKQHAQSEMKRIRENAKQRWGKEIPYNSIEDWR